MRYLTTIIILLMTVTILQANDNTLSQIDWRGKEIAQFTPISGGESGDATEQSELKSPAKALLFSLAVPGAGQVYNETYIRAGVMALLEVSFWGLYFYYHNQGEDKTDEYEKFADTHWSEDVFKQWLSIADTSEHPPVEHLPDTKTQQYYEMIGKYDWFVTGWDDFPGGIEDYTDPSKLLGITTSNRELYLDMRADANSFYTTAKYILGATLVNHIISGVEASLSARAKNKEIYRKFSNVDIRTRVAMINNHPTPKLEMVVKF